MLRSTTRNAIARIRCGWLDRSQLQSILEDHGFACHDDETNEELRAAIIANVDDGTIDLGHLPESGTTTEAEMLQLESEHQAATAH